MTNQRPVLEPKLDQLGGAERDAGPEGGQEARQAVVDNTQVLNLDNYWQVKDTRGLTNQRPVFRSRDQSGPIRGQCSHLARRSEALLHIGDPLGVGGGVHCNTVKIKLILTHVIRVFRQYYQLYETMLSMLCQHRGRHVGPSAFLEGL